MQLILMASSSAELHVDGCTFPVLQCSFEVHQATQQRVLVSTKVGYGSVHQPLDMSDSDLSILWVADPRKRMAADVLFRDANSVVY